MWQSERKRQEDLRRERIQIFDEFVDMALDNVITLEQALVGYKEATELFEEAPSLEKRISV